MALSRRTIVVLRALGLGDLLTAVPAVRALRRAYPDDRLVLATPAALAAVVSLVGGVDDIAPTTHPASVPWREAPPDLAVNLHGMGPQSIRGLLALTPRRLLSHAHPDFPDVDGPAWVEDLHEIDRWCRLVEYAGVPADLADLALARPAVPSPAPGAVVIHPGASHAARRWPSERYARVARELAKAGHLVVVTGSQAEYTLAERVVAAAGLPGDALLAGRTRLVDLAALVADAALVVCGDTGVGHLATAYGTPSVLLFGPVSPHTWGPPRDRPQHVALWAGRLGDTFADTPDPGLLRVSDADVLHEARRLLAGGTTPKPSTTEPLAERLLSRESLAKEHGHG
ncbi:glycosyltransferase family 9 protein [Thermasporomyces composti]|jgi:ADP-heptose:LPS heptosyltransferase|uniref:ADP-heptose:LPS heptosyltransferase n=1 Tax=Thermasporomyces composti TaxID=696763 RepID=A0A3D9V6E8_THECX|nr:glycosyltransferase family 9 protein [Thermasporomyces composti]REF36916.1 ADP-heptose:LPS heptosyltransferase [Thermasporomyces composti]